MSKQPPHPPKTLPSAPQPPRTDDDAGEGAVFGSFLGVDHADEGAAGGGFAHRSSVDQVPEGFDAEVAGFLPQDEADGVHQVGFTLGGGEKGVRGGPRGFGGDPEARRGEGGRLKEGEWEKSPQERGGGGKRGKLGWGATPRNFGGDPRE